MTFRQPPEWARQHFLWIGFPHLYEEWSGSIAEAQQEIAAFANVLVKGGDHVRLVCRDEGNAAHARSMVDPRVGISIHPYGDIWLRDTGPLIVSDGKSEQARLFQFNGWGDKYVMTGDTRIGQILAEDAGIAWTRSDWVLEGGAIDVDGTGLAVTTEQCLLNPNRNPSLSRNDIAQRLEKDLGIDRLLWLGDGLLNDHTDGHVDNLARFVAPGTLAVPVASGDDDPNAAIYEDAANRAAKFGLKVIRIPSPGRIERDGMIQPASHMNFVITNHHVVVPVYGSPWQDDALTAIAAAFPTRKTIGLAADAILVGGGSFHCASQQMPAI
jgi:agmatine deiminase